MSLSPFLLSFWGGGGGGGGGKLGYLGGEASPPLDETLAVVTSANL